MTVKEVDLEAGPGPKPEWVQDQECYIAELEKELARLRLENTGLQKEVDRCHMSHYVSATEEMYVRAFLDNQAGMCIVRLSDEMVVAVNNQACHMMGYTRQEMLGQSRGKFWHKSPEREAELQRIKEIGFVNDGEYEYMTKTGQVRTALISASIMTLHGEDYLIASAIDITVRKHSEAALETSEENFLKAFQVNPLGMVIISIASEKVVEANDAFLHSNGLTREEYVGAEMVGTDLWNRLGLRDSYAHAILTEGSVRNFELKYENRLGKEKTVLLSGVFIPWKGEPCILTMVNEITELENYRREMARLESLNLIGQMSASMAHEIRNPMTTVRGYLQLFQEREVFQPELSAIDLMIEELDQANDIITQLLSLGKNKRVELRPINLNKKILALLPLLQANARKYGVSIRLDLERVDPLMFDEAEIRQLIMNLTCNGIAAMEPGGTLTIRTYAGVNAVNLAISDQGSGIAADNYDKIGTPFFTTKDDGTGLGLAVCYSIAQRHSAAINFESSPQGTTFTVSFA